MSQSNKKKCSINFCCEHLQKNTTDAVTVGNRQKIDVCFFIKMHFKFEAVRCQIKIYYLVRCEVYVTATEFQLHKIWIYFKDQTVEAFYAKKNENEEILECFCRYHAALIYFTVSRMRNMELTIHDNRPDIATWLNWICTLLVKDKIKSFRCGSANTGRRV